MCSEYATGPAVYSAPVSILCGRSGGEEEGKESATGVRGCEEGGVTSGRRCSPAMALQIRTYVCVCVCVRGAVAEKR